MVNNANDINSIYMEWQCRSHAVFDRNQLGRCVQMCVRAWGVIFLRLNDCSRFSQHILAAHLFGVMFNTPATATQSVACTTSELNKCSRTHYLCSSVVGVNKKIDGFYWEYEQTSFDLWIIFVRRFNDLSDVYVTTLKYVCDTQYGTQTHTVRVARSSKFFIATIRNGYTVQIHVGSQQRQWTIRTKLSICLRRKETVKRICLSPFCECFLHICLLNRTQRKEPSTVCDANVRYAAISVSDEFRVNLYADSGDCVRPLRFQFFFCVHSI